MKKLITTLAVLLVGITAFAQPQVWQNYYSKPNTQQLVDDGNYVYFLESNQLIQFQKNTGYFRHVLIPDSILPCSSYHDSPRIKSDGIVVDKQGNLWLSVEHYDSNIDTYIVYSTGLYKYDGLVWSSYSANLAAGGFPQFFDITFDSHGNMWFMNSLNPGASLVKYDGTSFNVYNSTNGALPSDTFTTDIAFDTLGNVWMATLNSGVMKFDGSTYTLYNAAAMHAPYNWVYLNAIYVNPINNHIFTLPATTGDSGYYEFDGTSWAHMHMDSLSIAEQIPPTNMFFDSAGNSYLSSGLGILKVDGSNRAYINNIPNYSLYYNQLDKAVLDAQGNIWMTINSTFCKFDGSNFSIYTDPRAVLENNVMVASMLDRQGAAWFSYWGGGGLTKYSGNGFSAAIPALNGFGTPIYAMAMDSAGIIYYGTSGYTNVHSFDPATGIIKDYPPHSGQCISNEEITGIYIDKHNKVWVIGTGNCGGIAQIVNDSLVTMYTNIYGFRTASSITSDTAGTIWIGSLASGNNIGVGILTLDTLGNINTIDMSNSPLPENDVQSIAFDPQHRLWVGMANTGAILYDGNSWTTYNTNNSGLPGNHVEGFYFKNGKTFIATQSGIGIFDGSNWDSYTSTNSPLVDNDVESVIMDNNCNVWLSTECGLSRIVGACNTSLEKVLYGTIKDDNGDLLTGADVTLYKLDSARNLMVPIDNTISNIAGEYSFLTEDSLLYVFAIPDGGETPAVFPAYDDSSLVQQNAQQIVLTSSYQQRDIVCRKHTGTYGTLSLNGTLLNTSNNAVADIRLYLMLNGMPVATAVSQIDGHFNFSGLQAGTYTIWVDKMGIDNNMAPSITITNGNSANAVLHDTYLELLTVGIPEVAAKSLNIYPNPTQGRITCNIVSNEAETATLEVVDMNGSKVYETKVSNGAQTIDLSTLPNGIYILKAVSSFATQQQRLVILR